MGKRRTAREMAVQMLYQMELGGSSVEEALASFDVTEHLTPAGKKGPASDRGAGERAKSVRSALDHASELVRGTTRHAAEIDERIQAQADNWRLERMPAVDRNILRLAAYEMLYDHDTPDLVVVDEAIELAKKYGSEQSSRFINGLLDGLLKSAAGETQRGQGNEEDEDVEIPVSGDEESGP